MEGGRRETDFGDSGSVLCTCLARLIVPTQRLWAQQYASGGFKWKPQGYS